MTSDLLMTADTCFLAIVVLLDLSVALMRFLALSFRRDLHPLHPPQPVSPHISQISHKVHVLFLLGCPRVQVWGLFHSLFTCFYSVTFQKYSISFHCYTDDTPLYIFHPSTHLPLWLPHGGHSMVLLPHLPKIISNKTEVLLISTASTPTNSQKFSINVDNSSILLSPQSCQSHINRSLPTSTPSFPHSFLTLNPIVV